MSDIDLLVIDGHAMAYRAYYAMQGQNLTHPGTGNPTGAIYGFFRMLYKLLLSNDPPMTVIAFDPPGGTFRNETYSEYKATRKPMPEDLRWQIDEIKDLIKNIGFALLEIPGYEADDVMGSLGKKFGKKNKVVLITGDKDCFQLLTKNVSMLRPKKGVTEFIDIGPDWVKEEMGISVEQVIDYMGLVGDTSDNIPGAKGIGEKSAVRLIQEFGSIDKIYKNLENIKGAVKNKLEESKENVLLSRDLATIKTDLETIQNLKDPDIRTPDFISLDAALLFRNSGFNQLYNDILRARKERGMSADSSDESGGDDLFTGVKVDAHDYILIDSIKSLNGMIKELGKSKLISIDTETDSTDPNRARLVGISISAQPGKAYYIAVPPVDSPYAAEGIPPREALDLIQAYLDKKNPKLVGQNIKYDLIVLRRHGVYLKNISFDTMIASYLINPNVRRHNLNDMALDMLGHEMIAYEDVVGKGKNQLTMDLLSPKMIRDYACEDADVTLQLHDILVKKIKDLKLEKVNYEIETALIPVLADMETAGVSIDESYFSKLSDDYEKKIHKLEGMIHKEAGHPFNINSTKELQKILFEDLNLPRGKKTKTGYSTDQSVLEELRHLHPLVEHLLEHRKYSKLKSTYVDALPKMIHPETHRIHTSFNQTIAATGRLSSNDPNLQNIPIREETGRAIRRGFIPATGNELLSLDYSQIELRIMAHYSDDPGLVEAFVRDNVDIHARTAASLFDIEDSEVNPDQRSKAKVVNFSIIYGVTDFGLAQNLNISREMARGFIDRFFTRYPGVRRYMDETIAFAEKHGHVETLTGRIRQTPEIQSSNRFRKEGARRTAINTPIQGTSADIIKIAMIHIHRQMKEADLKSQMILQVHDELIFDVIPEEKEAVLELAKAGMENAMTLKVPLRVDYRFGKNWDEAH